MNGLADTAKPRSRLASLVFWILVALIVLTVLAVIIGLTWQAK